MDYRRVLQELYDQRAKLDRAIRELEKLGPDGLWMEDGSGVAGSPWERKSGRSCRSG